MEFIEGVRDGGGVVARGGQRGRYGEYNALRRVPTALVVPFCSLEISYYCKFMSLCARAYGLMF